MVFQEVETHGQRVDTIKREMFSQKSVRRFVGDSSAFVMGAMFLASALKRGIPPGISKHFLIFPGGRRTQIRHGRHVLSQCPKQRHSPPGNIKKCLIIPGGNASL